VTGAAALDKEPEGVTTEAQAKLLQKRRAELVRKIEDLEGEARRNEIPPGALRSEAAPDTSGMLPAEADDSAADEDPDVAETKKSLREGKKHLERAEKELDLLRRSLDLEQRQVYSNPEYLSRGVGESKLTSIESQISGKQQEIQQIQQETAQLEEHLEDLKLSRPVDSGSRKKLKPVPLGAPGQETRQRKNREKATGESGLRICAIRSASRRVSVIFSNGNWTYCLCNTIPISPRLCVRA
jgi:cell division protein FtsB